MVHYCCCFGCNEKFVKGGRITFHSFPKNEARRRIWLQNIQRENFVPSAFSKVCSKHFDEECFDKEKFGGVWLKADAVPTIFNFPKHLTPKVCESKPPMQGLLYDEQTELHNEENDIATTQAIISCEASRTKHRRCISDVDEEDITSPSKVRKAYGITRMQVADQRRCNKVLEIKTTGYKRKMNTLSTLLEELRQKVNLSHDTYSVPQTSLPDLSKQLVLRAQPESKKGFSMESTEMKSVSEEMPLSNSHVKNEPFSAFPDFVMDSEYKTVIQINNEELETKIDIKEESLYLDTSKMTPEMQKSSASDGNGKKKLVSISSSFQMGSKNNTCKAENKGKTEIFIKEEILCLENKSHVSNADFISASVDSITECKNSTDLNEMSMKIEIKEEPWWLDAPAEATSTVKDADSQDSEKNTPSDIDKKQHLCPKKTSRLYTERQFSHGSDISTFTTNGALESRCCQEVNLDNDNSSMNAVDRNSITEECHMEKCVKMHDFEHLQKHGIFPDGNNSVLHLKSNNLIHDKESLEINSTFMNKMTELSPVRKYNVITLSGKGQYLCTICEKNFSTGSDFKKHSLIHEGQKHHKCKICDKSFALPSHLKRHTLSHGERLHKCNICEKRFFQASALQTHSFIHGDKSPYKCIVCEKSFSTASYFRKHVLTHEGKSPHKCDICKKSFIKAVHLKTHRLIHSGERPHKCKFCEKSCTTASNLREHILVHNGIKRHNCTICEKKFLRTSDLKKHSKIHVNQRPN